MNFEDITKDDFIRICDGCKTKQEAYHKLNMHRNTFEMYANKFGYEFKSNLSHKQKYELQDILDGKHPGYSTSHLHDKLLKEGVKEYKCENAVIQNGLVNDYH